MRKPFALLCFLVGVLPLCSQTVQAPQAQKLANALMAGHPEMQTIGIHAVAPGQTQNTNIACSKPGKVGKVSAAIDMAVLASGKPYVRTTPKGAIDTGLPLQDAAGKRFGMAVIVLRASFTQDTAVALKQATAIRDELLQSATGLDALFTGSTIAKATPLYLVAQTPMPGVEGGFDHLNYDAVHGRIFVAAEGNHTIEVFNTAGELLTSVKNVVKTPHSIAYDAKTNLLFVADGEESACLVLQGTDLHLVKKIPLPSPGDASYFDAAERKLYVGLSGKSVGKESSTISVISIDEQKEVVRIGVPAADLEAMVIDPSDHTLYVNMRDKGQVAQLDLTGKTGAKKWGVAGMNLNTSMALDEGGRRLFIVGRKPGKLYVFEAGTGRLLQTLNCVDGVDDIHFDAEYGALYVTGAGGVGMYQTDAAGQMYLRTSFPNHGGKTSLFLPQLQQLYSVYPRSAQDDAGLLIYKLLP